MKAVTVHSDGTKSEGILNDDAQFLGAAVFPAALDGYSRVVRVAVYKLPPGPAIGPEVAEEAGALVLWRGTCVTTVVNELTTADVLAVTVLSGETAILAIMGQDDRIVTTDRAGIAYVLDNNLDVWRIPFKHVNKLIY